MKIIISGGSGLVGSHLIPKLLQRGHSIVNLTTKRNSASSKSNNFSESYWSPSEGKIDHTIFDGADAVINLAGFSVSNRWTDDNRKKMINSRIQSTDLLVKAIIDNEVPVKTFITASASGFYASSEKLLSEDENKGVGFLPDLTAEWEKASEMLTRHNVRRVALRIGVVLAKEDGALVKMLPFFKMGLGSAVGSGKQWMSWIHIDDLCNMFIYALDNNNLEGIYNAASPNPSTNKEFSAELAKALGKPFFLPAVPEFALKIAFGEMASMLLESRKLSSRKIENTGFKFTYPAIGAALKQILNTDI